jgi:hypothetical protein
MIVRMVVVALVVSRDIIVTALICTNVALEVILRTTIMDPVYLVRQEHISQATVVQVVLHVVLVPIQITTVLRVVALVHQVLIKHTLDTPIVIHVRQVIIPAPMVLLDVLLVLRVIFLTVGPQAALHVHQAFIQIIMVLEDVPPVQLVNIILILQILFATLVELVLIPLQDQVVVQIVLLELLILT